MYLSTFLLIPMTISYFLRKIVQLARFQGNSVISIVRALRNPLLGDKSWLQDYISFQACKVQALQCMQSMCSSIWPSLWMDGLLIITFFSFLVMIEWYSYCAFLEYWYNLEALLNFSLLQNNCIGEKNTRYFMAFLVWWVNRYNNFLHVLVVKTVLNAITGSPLSFHSCWLLIFICLNLHWLGW